jgi:hypothetical protein
VLECLADLGERKNLVDRQLQLAGFHRRPDVLADLVKDRADFFDGAGAEGDADVVDAARGMQVEIEIAMGAAEPSDIDDAALDPGGPEVLVRDGPETWSTIKSTPSPPVAFSTSSTQPGSENRPRGRRRILASCGASHPSRSRSRSLRPCISRSASPSGRRRSWRLISTVWLRLQRAIGHHRIVHGGERDG